MGENIMENTEKKLLEWVSKGLTWSEILAVITTLSGGIVSITTSAAYHDTCGKLDTAAGVYAATNETYQKERNEALERLGVDVSKGLISSDDYDKQVEEMSTTDAIIQHIINNKHTPAETRADLEDKVRTKNATGTSSTIGSIMMLSGIVTGIAAAATNTRICKDLETTEEEATK